MVYNTKEMFCFIEKIRILLKASQYFDDEKWELIAQSCTFCMSEVVRRSFGTFLRSISYFVLSRIEFVPAEKDVSSDIYFSCIGLKILPVV